MQNWRLRATLGSNGAARPARPWGAAMGEQVDWIGSVVIPKRCRVAPCNPAGPFGAGWAEQGVLCSQERGKQCCGWWNLVCA